jgi:hypothetical protein
MRRKKSFDHNRIRTKVDQLYYAAGIPSRAWSNPKFKIEFKPIMGGEGDGEIKVGIKVQEEWYEDLINAKLFNEPYLVYLSSPDADGLSDRLGFEIMKAAVTANLQVQITNAGQIDSEIVDDENVFMLHNVFAEANKYRLQQIRDWITAHDDCFRLVVISGPCPYDFSKMIYLKPDAMFKIDRQVVKHKIGRS